MVLTGVILSSGVVSAVNQSVVGANDVLESLNQFGADGALLRRLTAQNTKEVGIMGFFYSYWPYYLLLLTTVAITFFYFCTRKGYFEAVFCLKEQPENFSEDFFHSKFLDFEGCVFNVSVNELMGILDDQCKSYLEEFLQKNKGVSRVNVKIGFVHPGGYLEIYLVDGENRCCVEGIIEGIMTTNYATNNSKAFDALADYLSKNRAYWDEMSFGKVFHLEGSRVGDFQNNGNWQEFKKYEGRIFNISKKELRVMSSDAKLIDSLEGNEKKVRFIRIEDVNDNGTFEFSIFDENGQAFSNEMYVSRVATSDNESLRILVDYLSKNEAHCAERTFSKFFLP